MATVDTTSAAARIADVLYANRAWTDIIALDEVWDESSLIKGLSPGAKEIIRSKLMSTFRTMWSTYPNQGRISSILKTAV